MGLFSKLVGKKEEKTKTSKPECDVASIQSEKTYADSSSITEDEKPYYQADTYYTLITHQGTPFERRVITFDERKANSYPSSTGLYVAEILLLEYCSYGTYPKTKMGYPGFWWFEYGIRDIGNALKSLEKRGYIEYGKAKDAIKKLTVAELKEIAGEHNIQVAGKKADILNTVLSSLSDEELEKYATNKKYVLTEKGNTELHENLYVPYMHKHTQKTLDTNFGEGFNVWSINRLLKGEDVPKWREIIGDQEKKMFGENYVSKYVHE